MPRVGLHTTILIFGRGAAPVNASHHGIWLVAPLGLSTHILGAFSVYPKIKTFLQEKYPLMRSAALFYSQFLYEDPNTGYLISFTIQTHRNWWVWLRALLWIIS